MYFFTRTDMSVARIYFSHKGGKKGTAEEPGRAPKFTRCYIVSEGGQLLGEGIASPVKEIAKIIRPDINSKCLQAIYGKRFLRAVRTDDGQTIAILRGDSFSRLKGREESLHKALESFSKADRTSAWEALWNGYCVPDSPLPTEAPADDAIENDVYVRGVEQGFG